ncbi:MAG: ATP-binding protein [Ignavibacteriaceae bacterium]
MTSETENTSESDPLENNEQDIAKPSLGGSFPINDQLRLELHFNQTPLGIIEWDKDFKVIRWNPAAEKIFGYSEEEASGRKGIDLLVPENAKEVIEKIWLKLLNRKGGTRSTNINNTKYGKQILCDWYNTPLINDNGEVIGVSSLVNDITHQDKTSKIQRALYKISESVNTINDINELYEEIHSIVAGLMKAENFYIALYDEFTDLISFPYFVDEFDKKPEPGKLGRGLTDYILRSGQDMLIDAKKDLELKAMGETDMIGQPAEIWLGVSLKIKNKTIGVIVVQDYYDKTTYGEEEKQVLIYVSEQIASAIRKKMDEEELKRYSEELHELNKSKDKFFSIIAHDLRSPFYGLMGLTNILKSEYKELPPDETKAYLDELYSSTSNLYTLIENLLEWSRIQSGKMIFQPEELDFKELLQEVIPVLYQTAQLKSISIENCINNCLIIYADWAMIRSLMQNLISNAIKFTHKGGSINISCSKINDEKIEVKVKDTGVGMSEDKISKLFRIDENISTPGTNKEKGTGLGFLLCKEIVEKHGSTINVTSEIGKGSCFSFALKLS